MNNEAMVVDYEKTDDGMIAIVCPVCGRIIKGYEDAIKTNSQEWYDGYMHFLCPTCETELKVK